nr:MAG TPA: hypothetical protein [Caudoviricetes sp.]
MVVLGVLFKHPFFIYGKSENYNVLFYRYLS